MFGFDDEEILMLILGLATAVTATVVLIIVLSTPPRRYGNESPKTHRRRPSMISFYFLYVSLLVVGGGLLVLCGPFFPLGGLFLMVLAGLIIAHLLVGKESLAMHVFSSLAASMRQNLPLPAAMEIEAQGLRGKSKRVFQNIAFWLTQGFPLSESIKRGYPRCPGGALSMVTASESIAQTPRTLRIIERNISEQMQPRNHMQRMTPAYPIAVISIALMLVTMLMIFIVPKFQMIFADIGYPLPAPTQWLMRMGDFASEFGVASVPPMLVFVVIPTGLYLQFRPRRPEKPYTLSIWGDGIKWFLPPFHWFERMRAQVLTADFLHIALDAGATIDDAVSGACELDVNLCYRARLQDWLRRIQSGQNVSTAARKAGVGKSLAWALDTDINRGNTPAVLEAIASAGRANYAYARNVATSIFWPCVTLGLAVMVGFIAYALFLPMPELLNNMMDTMFT
ncbi:MAG: type II secretion system F family protein [Phycisphaerae bacterium]|nr:type II secretion system F family protein [Phycisphaerae bacterium]